jgi:hypothetical protein
MSEEFLKQYPGYQRYANNPVLLKALEAALKGSREVAVKDIPEDMMVTIKVLVAGVVGESEYVGCSVCGTRANMPPDSRGPCNSRICQGEEQLFRLIKRIRLFAGDETGSVILNFALFASPPLKNGQELVGKIIKVRGKKERGWKSKYLGQDWDTFSVKSWEPIQHQQAEGQAEGPTLEEAAQPSPEKISIIQSPAQPNITVHILQPDPRRHKIRGLFTVYGVKYPDRMIPIEEFQQFLASKLGLQLDDKFLQEFGDLIEMVGDKVRLKEEEAK